MDGKPNTTAADALREQYEVAEDPGFDPELDGPTRVTFTPGKPAAAPAEAAAEPAGETPRGPDGKFKKRNHSHTVRALARRHGYSDEEIEAEDPDTLDKVVSRLESQSALHARDRDIRGAQPGRDPGAADFGGPAAQPAAAPAPAALDLGLNEENCTPEVIAAFNKLKAHLLEQLDARLAPVQQAIGEQQAERVFSEVDRGFADLGAGYDHLFGKGAGREMRADDPAFLRRVAVVNFARANPSKLPPRQAIAEAARTLFGEFAGQPKPAPAGTPAPARGTPPADDDEAAWSRGGLARPTNRVPDDEPKGPRRAARAVARVLREQAERNGEVRDEDTIPE